MKWWPFIILAWNILLNQFVFGVPVDQLRFSQMSQMPSMINYIDDTSIASVGGQQQSLLTPNFSANQFVTSSGMAKNPIDTGTAAFGDFLGLGVLEAGKNVANAVASIFGS